jgi:predicted permease
MSRFDVFGVLRTAITRIGALFRRGRLERDLQDEVRAHLDLLEQEYLRRGLTPDAARAEARRAFGGVEQMKEAYRDRRSFTVIETTVQDIRYAVRTLRKSPVFTAVAVLSIALGIGANTAIFTLFDQVLLRLLPVKNPQQLVLLTAGGYFYGDGRGDGNELSYPMFLDLREHSVRNDVFSGMFCRVSEHLHVSFGGRTERVDSEAVSANYFQVLGVDAHLGRTFGAAEHETPGADPVVVLSYAYWKSRFGSDPNIVGKPIILNNVPMTIVGVAQEGFDGVNLGTASQVYFPITMVERLSLFENSLQNRRLMWLNVFGRLRDDVTAAQAQARLQPFYASRLRMEVEAPDFAQAFASAKEQFVKGTIEVTPAGFGKSKLRGALSRPLEILMAIVVSVLLIACANVANLLLARASARQREIALRLTLGATRMRIVRQLLIESVVLALLGGVVGLAFATIGAELLLRFFQRGDSTLTISASPDVRVLAFNLAISIATGVLFGLMPARQSTRPDLAPTLKNETGSVVGGSRSGGMSGSATIRGRRRRSRLWASCRTRSTRACGSRSRRNCSFRIAMVSTGRW